MVEITEFISPELTILVPVLYGLGMVFKNSGSFKDKHIPIMLTILGVVLSAMWVVGKAGFSADAVFTAVVQGILIASVAVNTNQIYKQAKKKEE